MRVVVLGAGFGGLELTTRLSEEFALVMPLPVPIPPSPDASKALLAAFAERGIEWHPETQFPGVYAVGDVTSVGTPKAGVFAEMVDVTFVSGKPPHGVLVGPSAEIVADKAEFGSSRVRRWFGRSWP